MSVRLTYRIDSEIFKKFPDARVGVGLARIIVEKTPSDKVAAEFLSNLKQGVVQKFIKQNDVKPINSHPKNNIIVFPDETKKIILTTKVSINNKNLSTKGSYLKYAKA